MQGETAHSLQELDSYESDYAAWVIIGNIEESNTNDKSTPTDTNPMSNEITPANPEVISDEQLEEVSGGLFDNNFCIAGQKATVNVLS